MKNHIQDENLIIPMWFVKLCGYILTGLALAVSSWAAWITIQVMENEAHIEHRTSLILMVDRHTDEINRLQTNTTALNIHTKLPAVGVPTQLRAIDEPSN